MYGRAPEVKETVIFVAFPKWTCIQCQRSSSGQSCIAILRKRGKLPLYSGGKQVWPVS